MSPPLRPDAIPPARDQLRLAAWCGLVAGYLDVGATQVRRLMVEPLTFEGRHQVWTAPVADLVLFTGLGLALLLPALVIRHRALRSVPVMLYLTLAILGALYRFPSVHRATMLLLALGAGVQCARWADQHAEGFGRLVQRSFPWLLGATAALMVGMLGWQVAAERRALSRLPAAARGAPNVLLIVLDTVRAMNLSLYGYARPTTPGLERRAARGVRFTRAFATAPWTLPSHASMLTGRYVHEMSADWMVPLDGKWPVLAEVLGQAGYRSAGFVGNTDYCSEEVGLARGFTRYEDYRLTPGQIARSSALGRMIARVRPLRAVIGSQDNLGRKRAPMITRSFLAWMDRDAERPFFALLNYYDAHRPYLPPAPFDTLFQTPGVPLAPRIGRERADAYPDRRLAIGATDAYDNAIAALDAALDALFRELERRGALEHTIIILTSDHGEEFLEHDAWDHGNTLYLPAVQVPLLVFVPGGEAAGRTVDAPVSLREIPATIADLAGLRAHPFPGRTLARHWREPAGTTPDTIYAAVRQVPRQAIRYPVSQGNMISLVAGNLRFIRNLGSGREELYDYVRDPLEQHDLSRTALGQAILPTLEAQTASLFEPPRPVLRQVTQ